MPDRRRFGPELAALLCAAAAVAPGPAAARPRPDTPQPRPNAVHAAPITSTAALARTVQRDLAAAGGHTSALVVDASTGNILVSQQPTAPRLPASVEKLFTTSAALFAFGPDDHFTTTLLGDGTVTHHTFTGTLYLRGGGDPTFGDAAFDRAAYNTGATVQLLLNRLHAAGIDRIAGTIDGDASRFDALGGGPDTGYRTDLETEGELSGLAFDAGFTSPAETALQPDPARAAVAALVRFAPSAHITVAPHTRLVDGPTPGQATPLASVSSPSLSTILQLTNAPSDNFFAETLVKDLAATADPAHPASTAAGAALVTSLVSDRLGLSERLNDGSGLSRFDRTTARVDVDLLEEMAPSRPFVDSLAVAGETGTLKAEMRGTPAQGDCRGKTGSLSDTANLVGYCTAADGHRLVFAFLENSLAPSRADYGHQTEADAAVALSEYAGTGAGTPFSAPPKPNAGAATNPGSKVR